MEPLSDQVVGPRKITPPHRIRHPVTFFLCMPKCFHRGCVLMSYTVVTVDESRSSPYLPVGGGGTHEVYRRQRHLIPHVRGHQALFLNFGEDWALAIWRSSFARRETRVRENNLLCKFSAAGGGKSQTSFLVNAIGPKGSLGDAQMLHQDSPGSLEKAPATTHLP